MGDQHEFTTIFYSKYAILTVSMKNPYFSPKRGTGFVILWRTIFLMCMVSLWYDGCVEYTTQHEYRGYLYG